MQLEWSKVAKHRPGCAIKEVSVFVPSALR